MIVKEEYYENITLPPIVGMSKIRYEDVSKIKFKDSLDFYNWLAIRGAQTLMEETQDKELKQLLTRLIVQYSNMEQ